ncbi:3-hydroxyacyl-CoA dehydrogenase [bacterium]|nr:3-hydroxyacyl-CoA dehydrogenase [bacterium]
MKIGVKGQEAQLEELKLLFSNGVELVPLKSNNLDDLEVFFDLDFDDNPELIEYYSQRSGILVFVGAVKVQLEAICAEFGGMPQCDLIGINSLPGFINRSLMECTCLNESAQANAIKFLKQHNIDASFVRSRVGMVTPRVICMIINEAFFTVQEGTAGVEDIDLGMKLGTAYPQGPFEWKDKIGIQNVYETLEAVYEDTKDERYKICSALKTEYLNSFIASSQS